MVNSVPRNDLIPLLALIVAILAVFVGPIITAVVSRWHIRNSLAIAHKQIVAPMRQVWINQLRDKLAEFFSIAQPLFISGSDGQFPVGDKKDHLERDVIRILREIELMLNPDEEDHEELSKVLSKFAEDVFGSDKITKEIQRNFVDMELQALNLCKSILKREWEVVKAGD